MGLPKIDYGGYQKSCMTPSTIYLGSYSTVVYSGHARFLVSIVGILFWGPPSYGWKYFVVACGMFLSINREKTMQDGYLPWELMA